MDKSIKNVITLLVVATVAIGGYYFFVVKDAADLVSGDPALSDELFASVQKYGERRTLINQIQLNTQLFNDTQFRSLRSFDVPGVMPPKTKANPFDEVTRSSLPR